MTDSEKQSHMRMVVRCECPYALELFDAMVDKWTAPAPEPARVVEYIKVETRSWWERLISQFRHPVT